jgi:hypothetical protein
VTLPPTGSLRCRDLAVGLGTDPIGTAGSSVGYLLVEWRLPWPEDVGLVGELARLVELTQAVGVRVQLIVPPDGRPPAERRLISYSLVGDDGSEPHAGPYHRVEEVVAPDLLVARAEAVATSWPPASGSGCGGCGGVVDLLVCTHGRRDRCCGSWGTTLVDELSRRSLGGEGGPAVQLWRTSHTGGHRFAPTAVVLPQGTSWAYLDADSVAAIVGRTGDIEAVLPLFRGFAGLSGRAQAADRAVLARVGWPWLTHGRTESPTEHLTDSRLVRLTGPAGMWEAEVRTGPEVAIPLCGHPLTDATKGAPTYEVTDLRSC